MPCGLGEERTPQNTIVHEASAGQGHTTGAGTIVNPHACDKPCLWSGWLWLLLPGVWRAAGCEWRLRAALRLSCSAPRRGWMLSPASCFFSPQQTCGRAAVAAKGPMVCDDDDEDEDDDFEKIWLQCLAAGLRWAGVPLSPAKGRTQKGRAKQRGQQGGRQGPRRGEERQKMW